MNNGSGENVSPKELLQYNGEFNCTYETVTNNDINKGVKVNIPEEVLKKSMFLKKVIV